MTYEMMLEKAIAIDSAAQNQDNVLLTDARVIAYLLENCEIIVPAESTFFVRTNLGEKNDRILRRLMLARMERLGPDFMGQQNQVCRLSYAYRGDVDFGHTAPNWGHIIQLGLGGLKERLLQRSGQPKNPDFIQAEVVVLEAAEGFMHRAAQAAREAGKEQMAEGICHLATGAPRNLFECYQLTLVFYTLQQYFDATDVRTMGRLDQLTLPFWEKETDKEYVRELTGAYIAEIDSYQVTANMPFAVAGTDSKGVSQVNAMSYVLLEAYTAVKLPNTKLHILCTPDMPRDFLRKCMQCVKDGGNSLVFLNDGLFVEGLIKLGQSRADAADYAIVGCYEASGAQEVPCSCNAKLNLTKALEVTLRGGRDGLTGEQIGIEAPTAFASFEQLYQAFLANVQLFAQGVMDMTNRYEMHYPQLHASPFFSACLSSCVEAGGDAYCDFAAKYNNSSVNAIGLATAVDSLYSIRKLVYEDKRMSLEQLVSVLDSNWEDQEVLRGIVRNKFPKYGTGCGEVDAIAVDLVNHLSGWINNVPNAKGGVYRLGLFSIDWRMPWGRHTGASADGRLTGDTLSQNTSATFGMDREGPTGHILSVAALSGVDAVNGAVLDIDLHVSAVRGENGTDVLLATLDAFLEAGGQTVHYNVLDTATLRDAQLHPENYPSLQVRMCGWNVLFTQLSRQSQDEFIRRSEMLAG